MGKRNAFYSPFVTPHKLIIQQTICANCYERYNGGGIVIIYLRNCFHIFLPQCPLVIRQAAFWAPAIHLIRFLLSSAELCPRSVCLSVIKGAISLGRIQKLASSE